MIKWLSERPLINWVILVGYYLFCVTFHDQAQQPFYWVVNTMGRTALNTGMGVIFFSYLLIGGIYVYRVYKKRKDKTKIFTYWAITVGLVLIAFRMLMPYSSESVHFIQYAIMSIIAFPIFKDYFLTLLMVSILGIGDECNQYFILQKLYLDWNDMVLNVLGGALGLVLIYPSWNGSLRKIDYPQWKIVRHPVMVIYFGGLILVLILMATWVIVPFMDMPGSIYLYRRAAYVHDTSFWYVVPWTNWHMIRAQVGPIILLLLPWIYYPLRFRPSDFLISSN